MFGDATTKPFVAGSAVHWYGSTFKVYEDGLDSLHAVDPSKDILFDEGTADGFIFNSNVAQVKTAPWFQNDDWYWKKDDYDWGYVYADKTVHPPYQPVNRYARDIIVGLNHWYTGWIDWNAVLNKYGALDAKAGGVGIFGRSRREPHRERRARRHHGRRGQPRLRRSSTTRRSSTRCATSASSSDPAPTS